MDDKAYIAIILLLLSVIGYFVTRYFNLSDTDKKTFADSIKEFSESIGELQRWITELRTLQAERNNGCEVRHLEISKFQAETSIKIDKIDKKVSGHEFKIESIEKDIEKLNRK